MKMCNRHPALDGETPILKVYVYLCAQVTGSPFDNIWLSTMKTNDKIKSIELEQKLYL